MLRDASHAAKHRAFTTATVRRSGSTPVFASYMPLLSLHARPASALTAEADAFPPVPAQRLSVRLARESRVPAKAKSGKKAKAASNRAAEVEDGDAATGALVACEPPDELCAAQGATPRSLGC